MDNPGAEEGCVRVQEKVAGQLLVFLLVLLLWRILMQLGRQAGWGMERQLKEGGDDKGTRNPQR